MDIAQNGQNAPVRISDIAERQGVSVKYLEKLIRELKLAGFIRSKRGPRGGHMLAKEPGEITVGEIVRVLEGDVSLVECTGDESVCDRTDTCLTRSLWQQAAEAMYEKLNSITLADLMADVKECGEPDKIGTPLF
ncbi:RrF2 family transcriptional regulator [Salidesulfovibrio brasiliensis]